MLVGKVGSDEQPGQHERAEIGGTDHASKDDLDVVEIQAVSQVLALVCFKVPKWCRP